MRLPYRQQHKEGPIMFEYKSEVVKTSTQLTGKKKKDQETSKLEKLDSLINERASEGWELVFHSMALDATLANYNILVTFRKEKE